MKRHHNFVGMWNWVSRTAVLVLIASLNTACNDTRTNEPEVVSVSPTPQPTVTNTVVISPTPQPTVTATTTVVLSPSPLPQPTVTSTVVVPTEPITDVRIITSATDRQTLANRRVQFTNTNVQSVNGDRTFWVGTSNTQRLFVVLSQPLDEGSAENRVVIKSGQRLDLTGVLKPMPNQQQIQTQWGLSAAEAQALRNQALYLQVDKINFKQST